MLQGYTSFLPEQYFCWADQLEFLIRILVSALFGFVIGLERSKRQKDAGIRTHCIIAVTSAAFMILSKYAFVDVAELSGMRISDPARLAAQVVSGISFLGAGVIFRDRNDSIKGLTTAAGMWATAAIGMTIGAGLYLLGMIEVLVVSGSQLVLHRFPIGNDAMTAQDIHLCYTDTPDLQNIITGFLQEHHCRIEQCEITRHDGILRMDLIIRSKEPVTYEEAMALLNTYPEILEVSV